MKPQSSAWEALEDAIRRRRQATGRVRTVLAEHADRKVASCDNAVEHARVKLDEMGWNVTTGDNVEPADDTHYASCEDVEDVQELRLRDALRWRTAHAWTATTHLPACYVKATPLGGIRERTAHSGMSRRTVWRIEARCETATKIEFELAIESGNATARVVKCERATDGTRSTEIDPFAAMEHVAQALAEAL